MKEKRNMKLVYCTRTVVEMDKVLEELKNLMNVRQEYYPDEEKVILSHFEDPCSVSLNP